ncbi:MAG TPA: riboflavin synthase [Caulobacteraceae bacterium]|nr:riboflavin synthase [Caulobacteraceae bacterium]
MNEDQTMKWIGVVDTMFARVDMGAIVIETLAAKPDRGRTFDLVRRTVPGFKNLAVEAQRLIQSHGCAIVVVLGMPGPEAIDELCAHEACLGIMAAQLATATHILDVFVHEAEAAGDDQRLAAICRDRCAKHALNAYDMLFAPESLTVRAGQGIRQGAEDAGAIDVAA